MILILTQCFPSRIGGVESLVSNLALALSKTKKIVVLADRYHLFYDAIFDNQHKDKILVRRIGGIKFFRRRKKISETKRLIESGSVELIISDSWKSLELGIDYFNLKKTPIICLAHGNELFANNKKKSLRIKNTLNKVDYIVANSLFTKEIVKKIVNPEISIDVIHPGALDLREIKETEVPGIIGFPIILTLARIEKRKAHIFTIKVIQRLLKEFNNIQYVIAGNGPEIKKLKKIVALENLEQNVKFVGSINDSQKKYLFTKTDLMVMPTLDESKNRSIEGFGISYLEAAFFGIPSIASRVGGTPEAVVHNSTGKIINEISDLYSTIKELLINEKERKLLGENSQNRAKSEFKWDFIAKKYLTLINSILEKKNK